MMKTCSKCGVEKSLSEFHSDKTKKFGVRHDCKICHIEKQKQYAYLNKNKIRALGKIYYQNNKQKWTREALKRKFNLTIDEYNTILKNQNGGCRICNRKENSTPNRMLEVDHCHKTGQIRGILCGGCNKAIGLLKDSPILCESAANYLKEVNGEEKKRFKTGINS